MKRSPSELRENTTLTGEEQAKNDNLTVEEVSKKFDFLDLDFSFDDFEIDLDIDFSFDDFDLDFLNERRTEERTESEQREIAKINCERTVRTKPRGSQEEAVKNPFEAVRKR